MEVPRCAIGDNIAAGTNALNNSGTGSQNLALGTVKRQERQIGRLQREVRQHG